jgi:hypothetical protein
MDFDAVFLIHNVIYEEGLYAYNMHNRVEKHFSIRVALVRSRVVNFNYKISEKAKKILIPLRRRHSGDDRGKPM